MSSSLEQLKAPIRVELSEFEQRFAQSMKTRVPLLNTIMNYIVRRKGKQIRPIFVLYSAGLCGEIGERTYRGAALVELLAKQKLDKRPALAGAFRFEQPAESEVQS